VRTVLNVKRRGLLHRASVQHTRRLPRPAPQTFGLLYGILAQIAFISIQVSKVAEYDSPKEVEYSRDIYGLALTLAIHGAQPRVSGAFGFTKECEETTSSSSRMYKLSRPQDALQW